MTTRSPRDYRHALEQQLVAAALPLEVDESVRIQCPFCEAEHENSLSLTRIESGLLYKCFRAKCQARGFVSSRPDAHYERLAIKKFKPRHFTGELENLPHSVYIWLWENYGITKGEADEQQFRYANKSNRIFMPTFDFRGEGFGGTTRAIERRADIPKTFTYRTRETSGVHYPRGRGYGNKPLCVVEDVLSAVKVSRYMNCCALLGTTINNNRVLEWRMLTDRIYLMLDADAIKLALGYWQKYGFHFKTFRVLPLTGPDPKDMTPLQLEGVLKDVTK